ncbi:MAG: hypothetical protein O8C66_15685 [Candidatus Methanoperedens sp.]|nr:hypothetical protein [Candidatus Methanoperedens sp.]
MLLLREHIGAPMCLQNRFSRTVLLQSPQSCSMVSFTSNMLGLCPRHPYLKKRRQAEIGFYTELASNILNGGSLD